MLETLENAIKTKIKENFSDFDVESFPTNFKEYSFTSPKGCTLIRYDASSFSNQQSVWQVTQNETYEFSIFLAVRSCYNFEESYPYIELLKRCLLGLEIEGAKITLKKRSFVEEITRDLWWGIVVNITLPVNERERAEADFRTDGAKLVRGANRLSELGQSPKSETL